MKNTLKLLFTLILFIHIQSCKQEKNTGSHDSATTNSKTSEIENLIKGIHITEATKIAFKGQNTEKNVHLGLERVTIPKNCPPGLEPGATFNVHLTYF